MSKTLDNLEKFSNSMEGHFYYSEKQKDVLKQIAQDEYCSFIRTYGIADNKIVEYTEVITDGRDKSFFDDAVYLGFGKPYGYNVEINVENGVLNRFIKAAEKEDPEEMKKCYEELAILNDYKLGRKKYIPMWPDIIGD